MSISETPLIQHFLNKLVALKKIIVMKPSKASPMRSLFDIMPQTGEVTWISVRPKKRGAIQVVDSVAVTIENGLTGDHYGKQGKRQVTLIQSEHLNTIASVLQKTIDPALTRRNIVVKGINLLALKDQQFQIGDCILEMTGLCQPCSRMERNLGAGGYNAMRGHGGITTKVIQGGTIKIGDKVKMIVK